MEKHPNKYRARCMLHQPYFHPASLQGRSVTLLRSASAPATTVVSYSAMALISSLLRCVLFVLLVSSLALGSPEASFVKKIAEQKHNNDIPGLTHITVSGAVQDGNKELEVWLETVGPGSGTPIHRHDCEEIFMILKGSGTAYIAPESSHNFPGEPHAVPFSSNTTFTIPSNAVHQVRNTNDEDLHFVVAISKPPIKLYVYKDWNTPHDDTSFMYPILWDKLELEASSTKDEL